MNTQQQQKALDFLKDAFVYNKELDRIIFNDDKEQASHASIFQGACFNSNMDINDFHYQVYNEAVDYIYSDILRDDCNVISEENTLNDIIDYIEKLEFENIEADVYTYDLLKWLQGDLHNISYCDAAMQELSPDTFTGILSGGQYLHKLELMEQAKSAVIEYLQNYTN